MIVICAFGFIDFNHQSMCPYRGSLLFKRVRLTQSSAFLIAYSHWHGLLMLYNVEKSKEQYCPSSPIDHTTTLFASHSSYCWKSVYRSFIRPQHSYGRCQIYLLLDGLNSMHSFKPEIKCTLEYTKKTAYA